MSTELSTVEGQVTAVTEGPPTRLLATLVSTLAMLRPLPSKFVCTVCQLLNESMPGSRQGLQAIEASVNSWLIAVCALRALVGEDVMVSRTALTGVNFEVQQWDCSTCLMKSPRLWL